KTQTILNTTKRRRPTPPPIPPKPLSISKRKFKIDTTTTTLVQPSQVRPTAVWKKIAQKPATVIVPNRPKKSNTTTTTIATTVNIPEVRTSVSDNYQYYNHDEDTNKRGKELKARSQLLRQPSNVPSSNNIPPSSPLVNPINVVKTFLSSSLQDKQSGYSSFSSNTNTTSTTTSTTATTTTNSREDEFIIMASGAIDPARLTQAQTLIDTTISYTNIPFIPQAPLHIIYKSLQQKLENQERHHLHSAEVKQALNRVRQIIHMTSITSPTTATTTTMSNNSNYQYLTTTTSLLDFPPVLVAYQLTLIDSAIFRNIQPSALLNHHAPKSPHPAITASTDFFNYLTRIIEHMILSSSEASGRAEQINFWIKVAIKCHDLKNFQTLKAIISALGTPPIQRLKRSWAFVPKKSLARLDVVNEIMTEHNNYERYRDRISRIVQQTFREPVVPFLGVFMHDVTYLTSIPMASTSSSSAPPSTTTTTPNESCNNNNNNKHVTKLDDLLTLFTNLHKHPPYSSALPPFCVKDFNKKHQQRKPFANESLELQQCIVTQYLLTRSFVIEKTVDELSLFREPPKVMRSCSATDPATLIYDGGLWSSSGSLLSFVGTNSTASSSNSRPISLESDDDDNNDSDISNNNNNNNMSKFWVFGRKSVDHQHQRHNNQHPLKKTSFIDITNNNNSNSVIPTLPNIPPKHLRRDRLSRHFSFEDLDAHKKHQHQQHQEQQQGLSIFRKEFSFWRKEQDGETSAGTTTTTITEPPTSASDSQHPLDFNPIYKRNSVTLLERTITS
ncbi:hypothetical protein INT45_000450, partial [Circinella minor]